MKFNVTQKILKSHLVKGEMISDKEIAIKIDQTLTQDATGTMTYLAFEALDIPKIKTELSVSYVDHNTLQSGFENADDHAFLQSAAAKFGLYFSRPGNGICHQVHSERFAVPGKTLLGSDSHTPTSSGLGMIAIGAGGMSVAMAMAGQPFYLTMPKVINVKLTGKLNIGVSAKDIILKLLKIMTVKNGVGKIVEYTGEGLKSLTIPERCTIANMGAELGVTTSVFPSDGITYTFMKSQDREKDWIELKADEGAKYDETIEINLNELEPMIAKPHMPDKVVSVRELSNIKVNQVFIGSCTNSSYSDLAKTAAILDGKCVNPNVSLCIAPGSKQVFEMIARDGILQKLISSGARILESSCGPCVGMGQSPQSEGVSLRTNNRNFIGRSGTADAKIYLSSPEVAAASAITGKITDPRDLDDIDIQNILKDIKESENRIIDDRMIISPKANTDDIKIKRGPNIKPLPIRYKLEEKICNNVILKVSDNITTDDIIPAGSKILPLRSNIPAIAQFVFKGIDVNFAKRAKENNGGIIVAGVNYGQGSSREHAALAPMYLGVTAILAKSFARIHHDNLINYGILPLVFKNENDYNSINQNDELIIENVIEQLKSNKFIIFNKTKNIKINAFTNLSNRQKDILISGGQLNYVKNSL